MEVRQPTPIEKRLIGRFDTEHQTTAEGDKRTTFGQSELREFILFVLGEKPGLRLSVWVDETDGFSDSIGQIELELFEEWGRPFRVTADYHSHFEYDVSSHYHIGVEVWRDEDWYVETCSRRSHYRYGLFLGYEREAAFEFGRRVDAGQKNVGSEMKKEALDVIIEAGLDTEYAANFGLAGYVPAPTIESVEAAIERGERNKQILCTVADEWNIQGLRESVETSYKVSKQKIQNVRDARQGI